MTTRVWFENDAIQMDGLEAQPARSLVTALDGNRVHVLTLSGVRLAQLIYNEYAKKDGSGFATAALTKAYLDAEFAKAPTLLINLAVPNRAVGTVFQPSVTRPILVSYSVKTTVTNPLLTGSSSAVVTLLSDAANPPTTERARVAADSSVGVAVAVAITTANTAPLTYLVPAGHYVRLVSTVTGSGATAVISQTEEVIG